MVLSDFLRPSTGNHRVFVKYVYYMTIDLQLQVLALINRAVPPPTRPHEAEGNN